MVSKSEVKKTICCNHSGKMEGMQSISTSVALNPTCQARAKNPGCICSHCYAQAMVNRWKTLGKKLARNTEIWAGDVLPADVLPTVNASIFRLESFGELNNPEQVINYFNLCRKNPGTVFALWTKNPEFIDRAIKAGHSKPENIVIIYSAPLINQRFTSKDNPMAKWAFIDKVFIVKDHDDGSINCGGRKCIECSRCYSLKTEQYVYELLK